MSKSFTPFSTSPNPNSLYLTDSLQAVVNKSRYVIDTRQGLTCIVGDIGFGKSTILRFLYGEYSALEDCNAKLITMPNFPSSFSMLKNICDEFEIESARSMVEQQKLFQQFLVSEYRKEKNVVLFIDEAQDLKAKQFELCRAILNFETNTEKLVQIVLAGAVELESILKRQVNRPLKSRIITQSNLLPLDFGEAKEMIDKRCQYSQIQNPFSDDVLQAVCERTGGVPRSILKVCGYLYKMKELGAIKDIPVELVDGALDEVSL
jgi:general secretion pathway protein A